MFFFRLLTSWRSRDCSDAPMKRATSPCRRNAQISVRYVKEGIMYIYSGGGGGGVNSQILRKRVMIPNVTVGITKHVNIKQI